jgi:hypothetical protein
MCSSTATPGLGAGEALPRRDVDWGTANVGSLMCSCPDATLINRGPNIRKPLRARLKNQQRAEELADQGRGFRNFLEWEGSWYFEAFRYLKGRRRVISLADYSVEKTFVLAVPHRFLIGDPEQIAVPTTTQPAPLQRRPRGCPF